MIIVFATCSTIYNSCCRKGVEHPSHDFARESSMGSYLLHIYLAPRFNILHITADEDLST